MSEDFRKDMEFLLNFVPTTDPDLVVPDLLSFNYLTGRYEGDLQLVTRIKEIVDKYKLQVPEGDLDDLCDEDR